MADDVEDRPGEQPDEHVEQEVEPDQPDGKDELDEVDEPEEIDAQPEKPPSRAESRFQKLSNTAREASERAARVERELQELRAERQREAAKQQQREYTPEEMALWSEDQRTDYKISRLQAQTAQERQALQYQIFEQGDKSNFSSLCARDQTAARYADEVEKFVADRRAQGQVLEREVAYTYLLGQKVRANRTNAAPKQRQAAERRIQRQSAPATNARSDQPTTRREQDDRAARIKRLEDQTF